MKRLDELFAVVNGVAASKFRLNDFADANHGVALVRPTKNIDSCVAGWISKDQLEEGQVFEPGTIYVSTNGEGSHTYAHVPPFRFTPNSDAVALVPRQELTPAQTHFYALLISRNRPKFSYARKPKGERLASVVLPEPHELPSWVNEQALKNAHRTVFEYKSSTLSDVAFKFEGKLARVDEVFQILQGHSLELNVLEELPTGVAFVSRTAQNNGVSARIAAPPDCEPLPAGILSVALSASPLMTFLQEEPFYTGYHVAGLQPLEPMTRDELLYYSVCLRAHMYKFGYGRQANKSLAGLLVPDRQSVPSWVRGGFERFQAAANKVHA